MNDLLMTTDDVRAEMRRVDEFASLMTASIERALWQICLQIARERVSAEFYRYDCRQVMEEQRERLRTVIAQNESFEAIRKASMGNLMELTSRGGLGLSFQPVTTEQTIEPEHDGIPRDANGNPINLD